MQQPSSATALLPVAMYKGRISQLCIAAAMDRQTDESAEMLGSVA